MYSVEITTSAQKDILSLPPSIRRRVLAITAALRDNPRPFGIRKLQVEDPIA
ncbi:MAG: hypothetical protein HYX94_03435 [Chloroflexi bacterium]|nr:hypothetical protein [Chloroflexota bacterium]